eukprot:TRINITY_DN37401_c0_g1_i1.p1 TRINITY_DN37401_c0_g1~~TRINITY_DN37401_c0_g1_i1.p1  ORF type:complete len:825 (-),score=221.35 TRINITY_DN37401_c0_g1_i1:64-2538(-)
MSLTFFSARSCPANRRSGRFPSDSRSWRVLRIYILSPVRSGRPSCFSFSLSPLSSEMYSTMSAASSRGVASDFLATTPTSPQSSGATSPASGRPTKLFIGGVSRHTTTKQLRDHFSQFGRVLDCVAMRQPDGRSRGFGYVTLDSPTAAQRCLLEPQVIDGRVVDMKLAVPEGSNAGTPKNAALSPYGATAADFFAAGRSAFAMDHQYLGEGLLAADPAWAATAAAAAAAASCFGAAWQPEALHASAVDASWWPAGGCISPSGLSTAPDCLEILSGGAGRAAWNAASPTAAAATTSSKKSSGKKDKQAKAAAVAAAAELSANAKEFVPQEAAATKTEEESAVDKKAEKEEVKEAEESVEPAAVEEEPPADGASKEAKASRKPLGELTNVALNYQKDDTIKTDAKKVLGGLGVSAATPAVSQPTAVLSAPDGLGGLGALGAPKASVKASTALIFEDEDLAPPAIAEAKTEAKDDVAEETTEEVTGAETQEPDAESTPLASKATVSDELPSMGSALHASGECRRCNFYPKGRCQNGKNCTFCHLPHEKRKPSRQEKRERRAAWASSLEAQAQLEGLEFPQEEEEPEEQAEGDWSEHGAVAGFDAQFAASADAADAANAATTMLLPPEFLGLPPMLPSTAAGAENEELMLGYGTAAPPGLVAPPAPLTMTWQPDAEESPTGAAVMTLQGLASAGAPLLSTTPPSQAALVTQAALLAHYQSLSWGAALDMEVAPHTTEYLLGLLGAQQVADAATAAAARALAAVQKPASGDDDESGAEAEDARQEGGRSYSKEEMLQLRHALRPKDDTCSAAAPEGVKRAVWRSCLKVA